MKMAEAQRQLGSLVAASAGAHMLTTNFLSRSASFASAPLSPLGPSPFPDTRIILPFSQHTHTLHRDPEPGILSAAARR